jgi:DNA-binding XRE family transcriptional regulator
MVTPIKIRITQLDKKNKELAAHIGLDVTTTSQYVTGKRIPPLEVAIRMARFLDSTVEELWAWSVDN